MVTSALARGTPNLEDTTVRDESLRTTPRRRFVPSCDDLCEFGMASAYERRELRRKDKSISKHENAPVKILMPLPVNMLRIYETNKDTMRKQRAKPAGQTVRVGEAQVRREKSGSCCRCRPKLGRWWGRERPPVNWIRACIAGSGNKFCITSAGATRRPDMALLYVAFAERSSAHWTIALPLSLQ